MPKICAIMHGMMRPLSRRISLVSTAFLVPFQAMAANTLQVSVGTPLNFQTIVQQVINFLAGTITTVATVMFLVGAFMIVLAGAKEDYKQRGKDLMIGSIMSIAVVLGAYAIYRTIAAFLA